MYITLKTTFTSTCYILTNKCCTWLRMTRHIIRRNLQNKEGEREKERQTERKKERQKERKKERKKERVRQESEKVVIKYMYITLNTTFTSTCYILTNKCCTWLRMTRHINRRNLQGKKEGDRENERQTERKKERQKERKKERKNSDKSQWQRW